MLVWRQNRISSEGTAFSPTSASIERRICHAITAARIHFGSETSNEPLRSAFCASFEESSTSRFGLISDSGMVSYPSQRKILRTSFCASPYGRFVCIHPERLLAAIDPKGRPWSSGICPVSRNNAHLLRPHSRGDHNGAKGRVLLQHRFMDKKSVHLCNHPRTGGFDQ